MAVSDSFNRSDSTDLNASSTGKSPDFAWTEVSGAWEIVSNELKNTSATATNQSVRCGHDNGSADNKAEVTFVGGTGTPNSWNFGVCGRYSGSAETFYVYFWRASSLRYELFKVIAGTYTSISLGSAKADPTGDKIRIECEGTTIRCYLNDVLDIQKTSESSITSGNFTGVQAIGNSKGLRFDGFSADAIGTVSDTIGSDDFEAKQVFQRAAALDGTGTVAFTGSYTGTAPTTVEVQIQDNSAGTEIQAFTALSNLSATGGVWSGDLSVPEGGWYKFVARGKDSGGSVLATATATSNKFGVGILVLCIGQSNMRNMESLSSSPDSADDLVSFHKSNAWTTTTGNGAILLANLLKTGASLPIGLLFYAVGGTAISTWDAAGDTQYDAAVAGLEAAGGDCEFILWHQGETDAQNGTTKAAYKTALDTLYSNLRTETGRSTSTLKFGCAILGNISDATATDATTDAIRQAQLEWIRDTTGAFWAGSSVDMVRAAADSFHWPDTGETQYERMARRYAQAILHQTGDETNGAEGPKIASATRDSGSTDIVLTITQNGGTALKESDGTTDGGSLTGFHVSDDDFATTLTISSTAFDSGNIVLTLSAAPDDADTIKVRHQYGENPSITKVVYDDQTPQSDTLGLPLQPTIGSFTATLIGARVPITGVSTTGAVGSLTVDTQTGSVSASVELPGLIATGGVGRVTILGATSQIWTPIAPAAGAWTPA